MCERLLMTLCVANLISRCLGTLRRHMTEKLLIVQHSTQSICHSFINESMLFSFYHSLTLGTKRHFLCYLMYKLLGMEWNFVLHEACTYIT